MTRRALELLNLPDFGHPALILDLGCGSGLSGWEITQAGHYWVGMDISEPMLDVARESVEADVDKGDESMEVSSRMNVGPALASLGNTEPQSHASDADQDSGSGSDDDDEVDPSCTYADLALHDIGQGMPFRPGSFDGAISISCLQWLCHSYSSHPSQTSYARLRRLFTTLYASLTHGARAVFQIYPENSDQLEWLCQCAMQCGFQGGVVVDYPNSTKRKKYFLCLDVPGKSNIPRALPQGKSDDMMSEYGGGDEPLQHQHRSQIEVGGRERQRRTKTRKGVKSKDKDWVMRKKETRRKRGEDVANDSKYTARKRRPRF